MFSRICTVLFLSAAFISSASAQKGTIPVSVDSNSDQGSTEVAGDLKGKIGGTLRYSLTISNRHKFQ
jgi:hypothetical protein